MQVEASKQGYRLVTLRPRYRKLEIPTDWKVEELGKLCKLVNGMAFKPKDWKKSGIPIIRIQNLNNEISEFNYYDKPVEEKYYVKDNDILFGWSGNLGTSFGAHIWKRGKAILNQHIFRVIPNDSVIPLFLFYILNSLVKDIELETHGSIGLVHVKKGYLESRLIPLPTKLEQQKIASILSKVDELIRKTDQIIEQNQRLKKGLMQKLLTEGIGHREFKKAKFLFDKNEDIPIDWEIVRLSHVCKRRPQYGAAVSSIQKDTQLPRYIRITDLNDDGSLRNDDWVSISEEDAYPYILTEGDIVFARTGATVGKTYMYKKEDGKCAFAGYLIRFIPDANELNTEFLFYYTHSYNYWRWLRSNQTEGVQPNVNAEQHSQMPVIKPSILEQQQIVYILRGMDFYIKKYQDYKFGLMTLKRGLIQQLLTGKIRVRV